MLDFYFFIHHEFLLTFLNYDNLSAVRIFPRCAWTTPFVHFLGVQTGDCGFKVDYT